MNIVSLRALDDNGIGKDSSVIAAIDRAIALKSAYNIRVMNLSLGRVIKESYTKDPLCQAVERAWRAGIVVVVAAGNNGRDNSMGTSGYATITSPWQRSVRHHGGRDARHEDAVEAGRSNCYLFVEGSDADRSVRQAGHHGSRATW